jgi:hypothetical protein
MVLDNQHSHRLYLGMACTHVSLLFRNGSARRAG